MFFRPFQVLHLARKLAYKLEYPKQWRMYNVFHVSLLEQGITRKKQVNKQVTELEFEAGNSKEYKVEAIWDSAIYDNESESGQLPGLYYLIMWKRYPKEENTWELSFGVQQLKKLINSFHKDYPEKPTATFLPINFVLPMDRPTIRPNLILKRKQGRPAGGVSKKQAKNWVLDAHNI